MNEDHFEIEAITKLFQEINDKMGDALEKQATTVADVPTDGPGEELSDDDHMYNDGYNCGKSGSAPNIDLCDNEVYWMGYQDGKGEIALSFVVPSDEERPPVTLPKDEFVLEVWDNINDTFDSRAKIAPCPICSWHAASRKELKWHMEHAHKKSNVKSNLEHYEESK